MSSSKYISKERDSIFCTQNATDAHCRDYLDYCIYF